MPQRLVAQHVDGRLQQRSLSGRSATLALVGEPVKHLRYMFDLVVKFFIRGCKYDWIDDHTTFDICGRCKRATDRQMRIARYRNARQLPQARVNT